MTRADIYNRVQLVDGIEGMTVNERLYATDLMETFDKVKVNNQEFAKIILEEIKVDNLSIEKILKRNRNHNKQLILYAIGAVAIIVIVWLILDNDDKKLEISELKKKNNEKDDINKKLQEKIKESDEIPAEIKNQLEELIEKYDNIDNNVQKELVTASSLIEIKEYAKSIGVLTKVIENLLKDKYSNDFNFKGKMKKKRFPALKDYIEYAKDEKLITAEEFHFANGLREIRNEDAHQLNTHKSKLLTSSAFLSAIDLILKISFKVAS